MRKHLLAVLLFPLLLFSQTSPLTWALTTATSSSTGNNYAVATDSAGNIYVAGYGSMNDFDPSVGVALITSGGSYLAKYNSQHVYQWSTSTSGTTRFMTADVAGNVYILGTSNNNYFVSKYNTTGQFQWYDTLVNNNVNQYASGIAVDKAQNVFISGGFSGNLDLDPSANNALFTASGNDIFFAKYNTSGQYQWGAKFGGTGNDYGQTITVDDSNQVILVGTFYGTNVDFDPGAGTAYLTSTGNADMVVAKYNTAGQFIHAFRVGSSSIYKVVATDITTDSAYNIYITGTFNGNNVDFDPDTSTHALNAGANTSIFVAKYNSIGQYFWAFDIAGNTNFPLSRIAVTDRTVFIAGKIDNANLDFDPDTGTVLLSTAGLSDAFVASYSAAGKYKYAYSTGSTSYDQAYDIALSKSGGAVVAGFFVGAPVDFAPGSDTLFLNGDLTNNHSAFLMQYEDICKPISVQANNDSSVCFGKSITLHASGSASYFWQNGFTNDSTVTIDSSNTFVVVGLDDWGCATVDTVVITAYPSPYSYTIQQVICAGDTFNFFGQSITQSGTYSHTVVNPIDCDSVFILQTTISNITAAYTIYPDTTTPHNWFALNQAAGNNPPFTYSWNWGDGNTSPGATPSHTYDTAAYYNICLSITDNAGCTDTYCDSSTYIFKTEQTKITVNCVLQLPNGIAETNDDVLINIFPNPASTQLFIQTNGIEIEQINIYNTTGSLVMAVSNSAISNQTSTINIESLSNGVYIAEVKTKEGSVRKRWVKM